MESKKFLWMLKKDLLSLYRHPSRMIAMFLFPIIMITLFGYGMGGDIENVPIVIAEQSHGNITDQTLMAVKDMSLFEVKNITTNVNQAKEMVNNGQVKAAIILPPNYDDISSDQSKTVVLYLDSSDQIASQTIVPASQQLFSQISAKIGAEKLASIQVQNTVQSSNGTDGGAASGSNVSTELNDSSQGSSVGGISDSVNGIVNSINLQVNKIYGNIAYIDFLVPAILAMTVMMSCMMGMGQSIAGERETGELARLFMTPTSVATVVGGKIFSKLIIEVVKAIILLAAAILLFGITINGNIFLAVGVLILGALTFVGFGIMISATAQTQEDYTQLVMPFTMPMMFVSGVFYPIETMPWIFQKIAYIAPLTYLNDAMRGVMLKGQGLGDIWLDILVLVGFLIVFFVLGVIRFDRDV
ncbi:ABC transporter permease [Methanobrevibacter sp. TMH8]|uniref:ABC transporter permease n=1 Tax=Methanobrevibacter sp. TMH8 TaxID=2848611 RepID=UPI001CCD5ED0|nr:ABC transporter permease [Methanobrevibacter sp. TMH8]MBZ9570393.1 ABC transporter permease [Methanobrevibacter sp. TMH8]